MLSMPRIGLDARMIGPTPTGLGTYARGLIRALTTIDHANTYVVIRGPRAGGPIVSGPNVEDAILPGELDTPRNLLHGAAISRLGLDLYHSLHHFLPLGLRVPRVVLTLHDLIWLEHAHLIIDGRFGAIHRAATQVFARVTMRLAIRRADRVISVSGHSAQRALAYYQLNPRRLTVVHHGLDHQAFAFQFPSARSDRYFIAVGNTRPYKNIATAIKAFAMCAQADADVRLVIAGRGDAVATLRPLAARLGVADRVRFAGPLAQDELLALLHGATALVFPSLIEGFGLPVLEAMAAGCPVIGSRIPTVQEIADDAALFAEPSSPDEFAAAMSRLLVDEALRSDLVMRGCQRASRFSWERCAAETLAVYQELL
jgi:glycosyltransferase involved in cell wall biosynthesis